MWIVKNTKTGEYIQHTLANRKETSINRFSSAHSDPMAICLNGIERMGFQCVQVEIKEVTK